VEYLEPEDGVFADPDFSFEYHAKVRELLLSDLPASPHVIMVCLPSFLPEWALVLSRPIGDSARFELRVAETPIWNGGESPNTVAVTRREIRVSAQMADAALDAWPSVLLEARPRQPSTRGSIWITIDGTGYHFAASVPRLGPVSGTTDSPQRGTRPGELVALAAEIRRLFADSVSDRSGEQAIIRHAMAISGHKDLSVYRPPPDPGLLIVYRDQPRLDVAELLSDSLFSSLLPGRFSHAEKSWQRVRTRQGETATLVALWDSSYQDSIRVALAGHPWVKRMTKVMVPRSW
jgi:hypothetical protein